MLGQGSNSVRVGPLSPAASPLVCRGEGENGTQRRDPRVGAGSEARPLRARKPRPPPPKLLGEVDGRIGARGWLGIGCSGKPTSSPPARTRPRRRTSRFPRREFIRRPGGRGAQLVPEEPKRFGRIRRTPPRARKPRPPPPKLLGEVDWRKLRCAFLRMRDPRILHLHTSAISKPGRPGARHSGGGSVPGGVTTNRRAERSVN